MTEAKYAEQEADFRFRGDYVTIDGTLGVTGVMTPSGGITATGVTMTGGTLVAPTISAPTLTGAVTASGATISAPTITGSPSIYSPTITGTLTLSQTISGTVGTVWTSAPPAFSTYQKYVTFVAGTTTFRIPVFDNA
jgi:hypothetical protein